MLKGFVSGEEKDIVRIPMKGKNLADLNGVDATYLGLHYTTGDDMTIVVNGTKGSGVNVHSLVHPNITLPAGVYTVKVKMVSGSITNISDGLFFGINKNTYAQRTTPAVKQVGDVGKRTFTLSEDMLLSTIDVTPGYGSSGSVWENAIFECWFYSGSDEIDYEPYGYQEGWEVRDNGDRILWGREDELQTATGTLPFKGYSLPLKTKSLLGNAVQNGTPAPDNIVIPEMCGVRTGNLCLVSQSNSIYYAALNKYSVNDTSVTVTGEALFGFICKVSPNTDYTVSAHADTIGAQLRIREYSDVPPEWSTNFIKQPLNKQLTTYSDASFTTDSSTNCLLVVFYTPPTTTRINIFNIMLNLGSTALPYEPYGWKVPFTNAGQTTPVYLGEVPTVRRVKKVVFDGTEDWKFSAYPYIADNFITYGQNYLRQKINICICSHLQTSANVRSGDTVIPDTCCFNIDSIGGTFYYKDTSVSDLSSFKSWLQQQYAAGHPVTVWYVLNTEETAISNEPLCKISTYADELTTIQVHGLSAPLYGIGDYKDTLNLSTGVVTRKVKKLVLDGTEPIVQVSGNAPYRLPITDIATSLSASSIEWYCSHYPSLSTNDSWSSHDYCISRAFVSARSLQFRDVNQETLTDFKSYLAAQYANGTPVTIWYVLAEPTTETVTVPTGMTGEIEGYLTQVSTPTPTNRSVPKWNGVEETGGTYAVTVYTPPEIPTTTGQNTLTVDTTLAPSSLTVKGHIKELT